MKPVYFTRHARQRMSDPDRGPISESDVRSVISNPDVLYSGVDGNMNALGEAGGKRIRVCYKDESNKYLVLTVINREVS